MSYRNYGSWSKGDLNQNYSSGSTKAPEPSATAKKYESSYSRSKPDVPAPKENVRASSNLDKRVGSTRYNSSSTASLREAYSPATYTRDKPGTREKDSTITAISNRYANYSADEKPDKQSVLSKYMNAKSNDKKSESLSSSSSYGRPTTNSAGRPRSRDHSPVDKPLYSYSRNISSRSHDDNHDDISSKSKLSSVIKDKMNSEREKDIPSKTTKSSSYTAPSYPSYKLYTRSNTYTRPLVKEEPKVEPVSTMRYNASTNRFGSIPYSRSPLIDKPSVYIPHISSSPSTVSNCSSPKSTSDFNFSTPPLKDEVKTENKECQNGNDTSKQDEEESESSEEESSESDDQSMITLDVVTRGTSPTAPCSSVYMRTRRADMAKTIEKTITRPKKKVAMVDKEMQSDRLDDSTRTSRYASTSRTAVAPWSSYMDSRYTSPVSTGRYSSGLSGSRYSNYSSSRDTSTNPVDKILSHEEEVANRKLESSIPMTSVSHDSSRSKTPTQPFMEQFNEPIVKTHTDSISQSVPSIDSFKEQIKLSPPRSIPVKDKSKSKSPPLSLPKSNGKQSSPESCCNLPPQVPKTDPPPLMKSTSSIHSLNKTVKSTGKKIIKKVKSKDGETKKRLVKRSVSISSGDSESSVQCGDTDNDCAENAGNKKAASLKKVKSSASILKTKSSSELKTEASNKSTSSSDASNRKSKSRSRTSLSLTSSSTETNSVPTSESEDDVVHESKTMHIGGKLGDSSRTSVMASSADEVSLSLDKPLNPPSSPNLLKNDSQPRTEEAKSFLMRALAPVTCLFKMRSQESDKGHWVDSTAESDNQNTLNVVSIETDTDSKSLNNKPHKIRHIESGEKAWWMESNSDKKSSENKLRKSKSITKSKSFEPADGNASENCNGYQLKIIRQESGEKAWWLESNANIPEGIEVRTPSRKGSSESEHSEKFDFYKIRHVDSGDKKEWWKSESDKSKSENKPPNGDDNFTLNVVRIRHIESGEKAWWLASNKNIPEGVKKIESSDDSDSDSSSPDNEQLVNGGEPVANGVSGLSRFPLHLPDYEDDEPLGDRKSPEGLETPIVDEQFNNRASPYDNVTNKYTAKRKESVKHVPNFISRHMDIDDILGSSGQVFSPMMSRILARKTGREIVEGDNSECREIDPGQVRIHDSTAQRPVIQRTRSRSDIIDCRDVDQPLQLDDSALQVYKDGDLGPYLDLESSLNEQQEDLEGFYANRKNSIILRTQLSVRVHTIIEKLLNSEGRELRRALFSLKQIFQEDKDLVHEFVQNDGLDCLIRVGADADQNYQNYILRALGQVMLYVDGMNGLMAHNASLQWLYSLVASKFRLVVKTTLKLLLVFVEYVDSNCTLLIEAIEAVDCCQGVPPWTNIMNLLKDYDASDTELLIYTMTLINKCLNGVSDRDMYYNQTDWLEEQGMYNIIQRYMARQGTDLDLLRQFQIYEAVLNHEDGDDHGAPLSQLDDSIRRTLRTRKSMGGNTCRRSIRHSSNGTAPNGDICENGASHYNQAFLQTALSDEQASEDIHAVGNSPDQDVFRDSKGHPLYTSGLQQRIQNGTLGHTGTKDYVSDVTSLNNQLNDLYFDKKVSPRTDMNWMKIRNENGDTHYDEENGIDPGTDKKPLIVLSKEQSVKDIAEKLRSPNKTIEEIKFNLAGDLSGLFSKAMEGLKKSKSKGTMKTLEKSEFDATWEKIKKSLKRELIINNLDFTDLCEDSEDASQPLTDNTSGNATLSGMSGEINESCRMHDNSIDLHAPPPPPFSMPPPPPLGLKRFEDTQVPPPPPNSLHPRSLSLESTLPANKLKTIKLFWREIPTSHLRKNSIGTVWDELSSVNIDKQKLQILFENKTKETMKEKQTDQIKSKELVILDQRRSNAINIALKKLPPSQAIKNAIIKMDNSVLIKEMVEKVLSLIPTEEETIKIQEAQMANPSIPLGTAEQFLITLSSITELNSRLKLWVFKLDFELIEADISEKLFDIKQAIHILKNNSTFKNILSVILTIGGFLNGTGSVKGFQIEYLSKISEVKDTLNKNSLMHTICEVMEKEHTNSSDLYSEIGAVTRAGKINIADICTVINKLEEDCKVSTNCYKRIIKHDTSLTKLKLGDFLTECLERIVILQVVRRRILIRAKTFLQWLGVCDDSDICENFKIISEFALEYRTTRERVLEQNIRKKAYRERSQTRGKLITENATASEKESLKNILISAPGFSRKRKELLSKGEDASEQLIEDVFTNLLKKGKKSQHKTSNKKLIKRSRTREGIHEDQKLLT